MSNREPFRFSDDGRPRRRVFRSAFYARKTSTLAVLSVLAGLLSFPMMCLCFFSIPFSLAAIVFGHLSRGIVRDTQGEYSGIEMATFGLVLGYVSLLLTALTLFFVSSDSDLPPQGAPAPSSQNVLLKQAEAQLLGDSDEYIFGVSTTSGSATDLARHYVDTLHVLDETHFQETNPEGSLPPRAYRAFVQLNHDSVAFLLFVPDYERFTDAARQTLHDSCWLIAQRSVDGILPEGRRLAVALYCRQACQKTMVGTTTRNAEPGAGLTASPASSMELADFFQVADSDTRRTPAAPQGEMASQIETKAESDVLLPAEAE